jgi:hypothetical protein
MALRPSSRRTPTTQDMVDPVEAYAAAYIGGSEAVGRRRGWRPHGAPSRWPTVGQTSAAVVVSPQRPSLRVRIWPSKRRDFFHCIFWLISHSRDVWFPKKENKFDVDYESWAIKPNKAHAQSWSRGEPTLGRLPDMVAKGRHLHRALRPPQPSFPAVAFHRSQFSRFSRARFCRGKNDLTILRFLAFNEP